MATSKATFSTRVLRNYSRWALTQEHVIRVLQRWWRRLYHLKPQNTVDCITLEPVERPVFLQVSATGHVTAFSAEALAQYLVSSGNFTHPVTREPFLSVELMRLDRLTQRQHGLHANQRNIEAETKDARANEQLEDFFVSEVRGHVQRYLDQCVIDSDRNTWAQQLRTFGQELFVLLTSLRLINPLAVNTVMEEVVDTVEELFYNYYSFASPSLAQDKVLVLLLFLKSFQTDLIE